MGINNKPYRIVTDHLLSGPVVQKTAPAAHLPALRGTATKTARE
jgi:hypothetical protein